MSVKRVRNQEIYKFYKSQPMILREMSLVASDDFFFERPIATTVLLNEIIYNYELELERQMESPVFARISECIGDALDRYEPTNEINLVKALLKLDLYVPDERGAAKSKDYMSVINAVSEFDDLLTKLWKKLEENQSCLDLLRRDFDSYAICRAGLSLIMKYRQSNGDKSQQEALICLTALVRLDFMKLVSFCNSKEYFKKLLRFQSKVVVKETEKIREEVMALANVEADKEWKDGDYRLHYEMARKLHPKYAEIFKKRLLEEALHSYSNRVGMYKNEKKYKERIEQIENGKGQCKLTVEHLKRGIRPAAEENHKYHDTGKEHRNKEASEG